MIKLIKSTFYEEKKTKQKLCKFITNAKQLSFGLQCKKFEKNFSTWQGRKYCIFLNSGSSANLAIIQALLNLKRIRKGDSVGFSAITWSTNVMPLLQLGLNPIPIDVELDTLNISSRNLTDTLKKHRLKMLFLTNLLGFCSDIDKIKNICKKEKIILIEDNCESLGTVYKGKKLGNFGLASTFSFYVGHHMSTIEGGAVLTNDQNLSNMLKTVRAHGWDRNLDFAERTKLRNKFKVNSTFYSRYTFYDLGYNFRPTEINGFIGNLQIKYLGRIIKKRRENFIRMAVPIYRNTDKFFPIRWEHIDSLSNFAVPIVCKTQKIRDNLVKLCRGKIEIRPIVGGDMVSQPFFKRYIKKQKKEGLFNGNKNASLIHEQGLYFGNNPELTNQEIQEIIRIFTGI